MPETERAGPLEDLTIIDCTMAVAGPFGSVLLADLGANVIKIEPPNGDGARRLVPHPPDWASVTSSESAGVDYGAGFAALNRNKRSVCLDLKQAGDREILLELCEHADAIVENMRTGVMDRLGVGYQEISARNPQIVYGAVRGYGDPRTGVSPYKDWPCLDPAGQGAGGLVEATGGLFPIAIADLYPGTLMAIGLLAAVHRARATGEGQFFDVAMYDGVMTILKTQIAAYGLAEEERKPFNRSLIPFDEFPAKDGSVTIAAPSPHHFASLCEAMGRPDLLEDERTQGTNRRANRDWLLAQISQWTSSKTKQEIVGELGGKVPVAPANTMPEIFADPHVAARGMLEKFQLPGDNPEVTLAANPIKFEKLETGLYQRPPLHGEHTAEVLEEFNINPETTHAD